MADDVVVDVSVGEPGGSDHNTLVVGGTDVTVPLELDLDDDPLQDDEVRLVSLDGSFQRVVRASDPDAEPDVDNRMVYYHFRGILAGVYRVEVNVAGRWSEVIHGLVVDRSGVRFAGESVGTSRPTHTLGAGGPVEEAEAEPAEDPPEPEYLDVNESFRDVEP